jgi:hypothetical protein
VQHISGKAGLGREVEVGDDFLAQPNPIAIRPATDLNRVARTLDGDATKKRLNSASFAWTANGR